MKRKILNLLLIGITSVVLFSSCDDDSPSADKKRNNWVLQTMKTYYYWEDKIAEEYMASNGSTVDFFNSLLYRKGEIDRWSFITDDVQELQNMLKGVYKSNGISFRPYYRDQDNSNDVICIIEYVEPSSPADLAELKRGEIFYKINGQKLTDQNFYDLIYRESQELTFGIINIDRSMGELLPNIKLDAVVLETDPILKTNIVEYDGKKIAYLAYNSFIWEYREDLKAVFANFKSEGVDELVLDLRYNSGGSVSAAILLCSMIAPADKVGDVLLKGNYNEVLNEYIIKEEGEESLIDRFIASPENLDLSRVVVLTTRNTASASEMVIYGLKPHMEVIQIGEQTHGKYYASNTFTDDAYYNWAMQPIIYRTENKDNSIDYNQGLIADVAAKDLTLVFNQQPVYELGEPDEEFFAIAIQQLTGTIPQRAMLKQGGYDQEKAFYTGTKLGHPLKYDMQYDLIK